LSARAKDRSGLALSPLSFGASPLGELFRPVDDRQADATLDAAWQGGMRYFDTSPWYGLGLSEHRLGDFLRSKHRNELVVSTKVGRLLKPMRGSRTSPWHGGLNYAFHHDYSYDGIMRSFEDSLQRLGLDRIDILYIHDLDLPNLGSEAALTAHLNALITSGFRALEQLRSAGDVAAFGAGVNERGMIPRIAAHCDVDIVLYALRYSLAEHDSVADDMQFCLDNQIAVVPGGVFSSGLYATGPAAGATYNYRQPTIAETERAARIAAVCARHGITLAAAALQFPTHHPAVVSVVVGADHPDQVDRNVAAFKTPIPCALWHDLKEHKLIRQDAPIPGDPS
jgi:D-threo-aldose 1-dehydrogenase